MKRIITLSLLVLAACFFAASCGESPVGVEQQQVNYAGDTAAAAPEVLPPLPGSYAITGYRKESAPGDEPYTLITFDSSNAVAEVTARDASDLGWIRFDDTDTTWVTVQVDTVVKSGYIVGLTSGDIRYQVSGGTFITHVPDKPYGTSSYFDYFLWPVWRDGVLRGNADPVYWDVTFEVELTKLP